MVPVGVVAALAGGCKKKQADPGATGSGSAGAPATPAGPGKVLAALGARAGSGDAKGDFTPTTKGFKFQNYGNENGIENLTPAEVERLFGPAVCADREGDTCLLAPAPARWMQQLNDGMDGGHCEGMAVLSLMFELGKRDPKEFGGATARDLDLAANKKLQHEIAYYYSMQALAPVSARDPLTPTEVVQRLVDGFATGKESYTLGFFMADGTGGHATTPYAVVDKGDDVVWILHYDNNFPGEERHIEVNRKTNTWSYFTAANPKEPGAAYQGDANTRTLLAIPASARLGALACPFCGDVDAPAGAQLGARQISTEGEAALTIADDTGKRIGHGDDGKLINEIAGASILQPMAAGRAAHQEPRYTVPGGHKLTITLDGAKLASKTTTDVSLLGPGYTLGVYDVALSPKEKDTIAVSADWREISYTTDRDETPELEIGIETTGADYVFDIHAAGETGGQRLDLVVDAKAGTLTVQAQAKDGEATYEVEVHKLDKGGEQVFRHKGVAAGAKDQLVLHYGEWEGNGHPMKAGVDKGDDGSIDETEELDDQD